VICYKILLFKEFIANYFFYFAKFHNMKVIHFTLESIGQAAREVSFLLKPGMPLLLYGEMGAGKTTLTKHIVLSLECCEEVTSPTFTIMQSYVTVLGTLWHIDLYRLDEHSTDELGLEELNKQDMMIVEWPERLRAKFFLTYTKATLKVLENGTRELVLEVVN
jgi:tRNA threonylcarbamoyladenosine biosynthesis protein TsaE